MYLRKNCDKMVQKVHGKEEEPMARASTKENKTPYQTTREALKLTRETASELLETLSAERIE